jgi:putative nucleotidyltransferase with HDIG domain
MKAQEILSVLQSYGHQAYICGGAVRDLCLQRQVHDWDICTSALPAEIQKLFSHTVDVGAKFGTVVVLMDDEPFEVTTFRTDSSGRHPDVKFGVTAQEDVRRRDFTINGLLMHSDGRVIDHVQGLEDIKKQSIRCIGDANQRFQEDPLRLLRAIRFAAELDFVIEPGTCQALIANAPLIKTISMERIRDEFNKAIVGSNPVRFFELLYSSGLLDYTIPELVSLIQCTQSPEQHPEGDVWRHTMLMLGHGLELGWAALLHDIGKPATKGLKGDKITFYGHPEIGATMAKAILERFKFSNSFVVTVTTLVASHMDHLSAMRMKPSTFKRFISRPTFGLEMELHRLDAMASSQDLSDYEDIIARKDTIPDMEIQPEPLVVGRDLIAAGLKPGPDFKIRLYKAYDAQLEGASKEEALHIAME